MDNNNMKCKCNNKIPAGRIALGYSNCVNCSSTKQYSYVPIIANKQVLEIQIVSTGHVSKMSLNGLTKQKVWINDNTS